jgi:nitroimidazol reductase NimA-like FMN-containing flavoprotein (pyridoxamine 5'-phosphate oxidase superfamily)
MRDLHNDEMRRILHTVKDGVLALCDDGRPYCLPFGFVCIEDTVYISLFPRGRKWVCIQKNPRACFTAFAWNDDRTEWSSVVIDGELTLITDMEIIRSVVQANMLKMGLDPAEYLEKRMRYYEQALENPRGLKIMRIVTENMGGKTMPSMIGR